MRGALQAIPFRILVTGSRGKSSLTRLLHAAFCAAGKPARARITGVLPRELGPDGSERVIRRTSPAHIGEMQWWLRQAPPGTQALVLENSAVAPDLQGVAAAALRPTLTVWTTLRPDHTEVWGPGIEGAARTLLRGVPAGGLVAAGAEVNHPDLVALFRRNGNAVHFAPSGSTHQETNEALALLAVTLSLPGADLAHIRSVLTALPPDVADFRIIRHHGDSLAVAFSANDTESTIQLFAQTGWDPTETTLLYHHRPDRTARLHTFLPWITSRDWKETVFSRAGGLLPDALPHGRTWCRELSDPQSFRRWWAGRGKVFACGNVAGWPLTFLREETAV